ncbi:MAG: flagellar biosynthetic protein FliO [Anaerobiospirillum succiniciproducens]|uniref:flagellar biosynthetic protein FliO n=1 Tax=Anaerobiospirillum succiniciproducens TaxID=13335 RepID=UPI0026DD039B|nr:flagellar biosynthetic protein FliO [Anaerobiospirillum succiniciproducens]MDO4675270.1 flagellar biosynthetic protein FliO [Anaerobiospirillum succiniciproducens]
MRTAHSYTSAVRGFLNQDLYILKPFSFKQVTKASCFFFALTCSSFALFSSSQVLAQGTSAATEVAANENAAAQQTAAQQAAAQTTQHATAAAKDAEEAATADAKAASENDKAVADSAEQNTVKVAVDQTKNDQKPQVVDLEFNETAAADDAIMAEHATAALADEAQGNELQPSAQDKASAVEKFNAFAADRPKRSGSLAEGGLNTTSGIIQWLLSTIAVLGIIFILAFLIKKSRFVQRSGSSIRLETQMALGPKERIVQVRVGDRHLLLGVTPSNINLILELDNDSQKEAKAAKAAASKEKSESYEEYDSDYFDEELNAKSLKSSETKLASKDITKAKIKAQAARKVAARATSNLTMMPDDDVLHERSSRLKHAMRHIGMDEQGNGELPSVEKTSVVFSEKAAASDVSTNSALDDDAIIAQGSTADGKANGSSAHNDSCMTDAKANTHSDHEKLSDAITAAVGDASEQADVSELKQAQSEQSDATKAGDALQNDKLDCDEQLAADSASNDGNIVTSSNSVSALVKDKIAAKDGTVPVADGSTGVTWVDHGHNVDAEDEQKTNDHAHSDAHSSMADADSRTSKADPKGEEFAKIFAKAYAEGKERFDELSETEAGRDIMAADSDVSDDASDKKDSKEKYDL